MIRRTACLIARDDDLYRNLAIEKHLMDTLPEDTAILYLWQNRHAVVIGRNQDPWTECAVGSFLSAGGQLSRRYSGGGTQYHDLGTLNYSMILPKSKFDISTQLSVVGMAVGAFGLQPHAGGRSSLSVEGCKFSDSAFLKSGSAACHQGTLLLNTDLNAMQRFLPGTPGKLASRVVNLSTLAPQITAASMQQALYWAFGRAYGAQPALLDERMLNTPAIETLTDRFADGGWIYPAGIQPTLSVTEQFPWGNITVRLRTDRGVIREARLFTDAMEAGLFPQIEQAITGAPLLVSSIAARIDQRLSMLRDPYLLQIADDVQNLLSRHLRGR
ncbi:MAG: hypothetical protein IJ354_00235 [Clostridia bacterium]|nr:hypothetical protein [Clostridia bacterium]